MAEPKREAADERLNRLEAQMDTVLGHLERLSARLEAAPTISMEARIDPATAPAAVRPVEPEHPWIRTDQPPPSTTGEAPIRAERFVYTGPISSGPSLITPTPPAPPIPREPFVPRVKVDWEDVIGRQWALWVGAIAVFLAVAFFLAFTWDRLSPAGRLGVGACAGLTLMFGGEFARKRTQAGFSEGLAGAGLAILYLDAWAACSQYAMATFDLALAMMVAITVVGVVLAVRYDSKALHALATIGGFATPALLGNGGGAGGSMVPFLSYITVLNAGVLAVAAAKEWRENVAFCALATLALFTGWSQDAPWMQHRWLTFTFVTLNYLLYAAAATSPAMVRQACTGTADWLLLLASTTFYFVAGYSIITGALGDVPAAFPVALAALFGAMALISRAQAPRDEPLQMTCIGIACSLAALAVPIQLRQGWITVGWSVEAAVLLSIAAFSQSEVFKRAGQATWALALLALFGALSAEPVKTALWLFNEHGIPVLAFALCSAWAAEFKRHTSTDEARPLYAFAWVAAGAWLLGEQVLYGFSAEIYTLPRGLAGGEPYIAAMALAVYAVVTHSLSALLKDAEARATAIATAGVAVLITLGASGVATAAWKPLFNPRFAAYLVNVLSLIAIAWVSRGKSDNLTDTELGVGRGVAPVAHVLILVCAGYEIVTALSMNPVAGWHETAVMTVAAFCCSYAAMLLLPIFSPERTEIRWLALITAGVGACALLSNAVMTWNTAYTPLLNARFVDFAIVSVALALVASLSAPYAGKEGEFLPMTALVAAATVGLWALTQETWGTFSFYQAAIGEHWQRWAQSAVSVVWTATASTLLLIGVARGQRLTRVAALGLFGATVAKAFLFDLGFLENQYRVLSIGGLGVALIGVSWLYSRFGGGDIGHGLSEGGAFAHRH